MTARRLQDHPYSETARLMEERLAAQRDHDRRRTGVTLFSSVEAEREYRARAAELRDLARRDYAWLDGLLDDDLDP